MRNMNWLPSQNFIGVGKPRKLMLRWPTAGTTRQHPGVQKHATAHVFPKMCAPALLIMSVHKGKGKLVPVI